MINVLILRCADPETFGYYYYFADSPIRNDPPDCQYNKKLRCHRLMQKPNSEVN